MMSQKYAKNLQNEQPGDLPWWVSPVISILIILAALILGGMFSGCSTTVTPKQVQASTASFDGGVQNSGLLSTITDSNGVVTAAIITAHARDRYNGLIVIYGTNFVPPLTMDAGITPLMMPMYVVVGKPPPLQTYYIDAEHLADFMRMNRWHRMGFVPPK